MLALMQGWRQRAMSEVECLVEGYLAESLLSSVAGAAATEVLDPARSSPQSLASLPLFVWAAALPEL